mmetsp:Transcript_73009/g.171157  ORF Transcript_73009/g.171157 Transcript_73009/m.171157 type:complete len:254 (+) Transcript_73009:1005-1766(+)
MPHIARSWGCGGTVAGHRSQVPAHDEAGAAYAWRHNGNPQRSGSYSAPLRTRGCLQSSLRLGTSLSVGAAHHRPEPATRRLHRSHGGSRPRRDETEAWVRLDAPQGLKATRSHFGHCRLLRLAAQRHDRPRRARPAHLATLGLAIAMCLTLLFPMGCGGEGGCPVLREWHGARAETVEKATVEARDRRHDLARLPRLPGQPHDPLQTLLPRRPLQCVAHDPLNSRLALAGWGGWAFHQSHLPEHGKLRLGLHG